MNSIVLISVVLVFASAVAGTKPGYCPTVALDQVGLCSDECTNDWNCPGRTEKCCSNGCGHTCQQARTTKPGDCPAIDEDSILCIHSMNPCKTDMDCEGVEKCCWTGCSPICTKPAPRDGMCPATESMMGICFQECSEDHECEFPQKCCSNGCGHTCQMPEVPKPGLCPAVEEGMVGICSEDCSLDRDCEGDKKCCSNGCGHTCKAPANETCEINGKLYLPGPVPDPDRCNSCRCGTGGGIGCTRMLCTCEISGERYLMGESYPAGDGCNTCKCTGDRGHMKTPCTDYYCESPQGPMINYMTVAIASACLGALGLIITFVAVVCMFFIYKKKRSSAVNSHDQIKNHLVEAEPLPPKA